MKLKISILFLILIVCTMKTSAQHEDALPYREVPEYPDNYTAGTMASRMIDGLGFRFYWATEGLRDQDLAFRPNEASRSSGETIDHILLMTQRIVNAVQQKSTTPPKALSFHEKRRYVLNSLKTVSEILHNSTPEDLESYTIALGNKSTLPFWNFVNGQIADCIWHCGQISSFRRMTGNPFSANVNLFRGEVKEWRDFRDYFFFNMARKYNSPLIPVFFIDFLLRLLPNTEISKDIPQ